MDIRTIKNNAEWLSTYDSNPEINEIRLLVKENSSLSAIHSAIDIGCGNGRSIKLLNILFPLAKITAIDKCSENINYALNYCFYSNVEYLCGNAFDLLPCDCKFDLALYSWSLFDMSGNKKEKKSDLYRLLKLTLSSLKFGGIILVLQPSKGGLFEKLLSKFMPDSEEDYKMTHEFLQDFGFTAAATIWSSFNYIDEDQLFRGVSSILALECDEDLSKEKFNDILHEFKIENSIKAKERLLLTDCVNAYYLIKE